MKQWLLSNAAGILAVFGFAIPIAGLVYILVEWLGIGVKLLYAAISVIAIALIGHESEALARGINRVFGVHTEMEHEHESLSIVRTLKAEQAEPNVIGWQVDFVFPAPEDIPIESTEPSKKEQLRRILAQIDELRVMIETLAIEKDEEYGREE